MSSRKPAFLKASFAAVVAALPLAAFAGAPSAGPLPAPHSDWKGAPAKSIPVWPRPAGYAAEKAEMLAALETEQPLKSVFHRDAQVRQLYPETDCTTLDGATGGPKVGEALRTLRESDTLTGPLMRHYMAANDLWYCDRQLSHVQANLWGLSFDYNGIVAVNAEKPEYRLLGVSMHETLHIMQKTRGLAEIDPQGDIYSLQSRFLANEAAAHALEVAYAYELAQTGDRRAWDGLQTPLIFPNGTRKPSPYLHMQEAFAKTYHHATASGESHAQALREGAQAAVTAFMTVEQEQLDIYNTRVLQIYLARVGGELKGPGVTTWGDDKTLKSGQITDHFSLTEGFTLPPPAGRFGDNARMRWAFEAVELYRKKTAGDTEDYTALRAKADAGGNPYLDLDMKEVLSYMPGAFFGVAELRPVVLLDRMVERDKASAPKDTSPKPGPQP
jgi:hypothetical protein